MENVASRFKHTSSPLPLSDEPLKTVAVRAPAEGAVRCGRYIVTYDLWSCESAGSWRTFKGKGGLGGVQKVPSVAGVPQLSVGVSV